MSWWYVHVNQQVEFRAPQTQCRGVPASSWYLDDVRITNSRSPQWRAVYTHIQHHSFIQKNDGDGTHTIHPLNGCIYTHTYYLFLHTEDDVIHPIRLFMYLYTLVHTIHSYTPFIRTHRMMWCTLFICFVIYIHSYTPCILTHHSFLHTIHSYTPNLIWCTLFICFRIYIHSYTPFILSHRWWYDAHYSSVYVFILTHLDVLESIAHSTHHSFYSYTPFIYL